MHSSGTGPFILTMGTTLQIPKWLKPVKQVAGHSRAHSSLPQVAKRILLHDRKLIPFSKFWPLSEFGGPNSIEDCHF